ncbi:MAG TPA: DciA family protein [Allosphingosinicella sp.]
MAKSGGPTEKKKSAKAAEEPQRARRARQVSDMLPDVGRAAFRRFGFVQSSIVSRWKEIVGDRYASVSAPESIRFPHGKRSEGVLTLVVEGAHAPMMQHVAPVIVERVNRFFGYTAVERVTFKQGIVKVAKAKARVAPPSLRPIPAELGDSLRPIADPELRAVLESLARGVAASEGQQPEVTTIPVVGKLVR